MVKIHYPAPLPTKNRGGDGFCVAFWSRSAPSGPNCVAKSTLLAHFGPSYKKSRPLGELSRPAQGPLGRTNRGFHHLSPQKQVVVEKVVVGLGRFLKKTPMKIYIFARGRTSTGGGAGGAGAERYPSRARGRGGATPPRRGCGGCCSSRARIQIQRSAGRTGDRGSRRRDDTRRRRRRPGLRARRRLLRRRR